MGAEGLALVVVEPGGPELAVEVAGEIAGRPATKADVHEQVLHRCRGHQ